jgi:hypothetical protein
MGQGDIIYTERLQPWNVDSYRDSG